MNIDERVKKAYALHHSGYNCAQAVLGAYVDLFDLDMDRAMTIALWFWWRCRDDKRNLRNFNWWGYGFRT